MLKRMLLAAAVIVVAAGPALAQYGGGGYGGGGGRGRGPSITLYSGPGFSGRQVTFYGSQRNLADVGFNDRAMSVRARGPWKICMDRDYRSRCEWVNGDMADLNRIGMGRTVSSVVLADDSYGGGGGGGGYPGGGYPPGGGGGYPPGGGGYPPGGGGGGGRLVLYAQPNFRGERIELYDADSNLAYRGFNDRAMSARVEGGPWTVCTDKDFRSRCIALRGDQPYLPGGIGGAVSSARPGY